MAKDHDHLACYDGQTRDQVIENNRLISETEGFTEGETFINEIETRLALPLEFQNAADVRLGTAYIACLAQYEGEFDDYERTTGWAPLRVEDLVTLHGVTRNEATVIVFMTAMEYLLPG